LSGCMNPFGIFHAMVGAFDIVGQALGRKRKQETRRQRITFAILYVLLLLLGVGAIVLVVWQLYFQS
jgi:Na+-driven multidrug efflux pump